MKKRALLLFLCTISFLSGAQTGDLDTEFDSLLTVWKDETKSATDRTIAFKKFIWDGYLFSDPDSALVLSKQMFDFGYRAVYPKAINQALTIAGITLTFRGDYKLATKYINLSLKGSKAIGDKAGISENHIVLGAIFEEQDDYPQAIENYNKALFIDEEIGNKEGIAMSLNNIGNIYTTQDNIERALEYYQKALAIDEELGILLGVATEVMNIASINKQLGNMDVALEYAERAYELMMQIGDYEGVPSALNLMGDIYKLEGNLEQAMISFQKSMEISRDFGNPKGVAISYVNIGFLKLTKGNLFQAIENCLKARQMSEELGLLQVQSSACRCLHKSYKSLGQSDMALYYYEEMIELRDQIYNEENTQKLTRLEMQYEFDKKETAARAEQDKKDALTQKELQRQKLVRNAFISGFIAVLLFAFVFFVQRNKISKEKERSEELLLNILPEETAKELKEKGSADAQLIEHVTVLFTDFKGFTALSEKLSPKALVKDLHECFSAFDRICEKYGIEKIKTIGDAYMAAGGLPTPNQTHAQDVLKAALEIVAFVELGKQRKIENGEPFFEIRVGVHTGPVVAGIVGVKKFQYDIWGDTVNTASRMESSGAVGKVNVSQSTYDILKDEPAFSFESRGKIAAKGKGEIDMYFASKKITDL